MKNITALVWLLFAATAADLVHAMCHELVMIPFGEKVIAKHQRGTCGYQAFIDEDDVGTPLNWNVEEVMGDPFQAVTLPMGFGESDCFEVERSSDNRTLWQADAVLYLRRAFRLEPEVIQGIESVTVRLIMDGKVDELYLNGESLSISFDPREGCRDATRIDKFDIQSELFANDTNVLALRVRSLTTAISYIDMQLSVTTCDAAKVSKVYEAFQKPLLESDFTRCRLVPGCC